MIAFIIKSGLCMVLFFGLYWLLLRKEKLFMFNRYYLIFSILFSLTVPFVAIPVVTSYNYEKATNIAELLNPGQESSEDLVVLPQLENVLPAAAEINSGGEPAVMQPQTKGSRRFFLLIYCSGLILMLLRFLRNILIINRMFRRSEKIDNDWYRIALLDHPVNPFSFLRTVFLNKQDYLQNRISANVLMHELEHVRQAHSRDIIFFEILQMILWFNPVLFLFKRAARINHEYLADEAVVRSVPDIKNYAGELINYISRRRNVTFASGFSPSMIRLRLLMLNSNTSRRGKTIRMVATLFTSVLLMSFLSIRPEYPGSGNSDNRKRSPQNKDIVIEEVQFRGPDFNPLKSLVIFNGRELSADEMITFDPQQIKTIDILPNRKAVRRYGKKAKDGAVEISTYDYAKKSVPDSLNFKSVYTVNDRLPEGELSILVSNLRSLKIWNYPILPNQTIKQHWRTVEVMTRDFYRIRGKVIRKNGEPVPGALVKASGNPAQVRTDNEGRFLLEDVNLGAMAELSAEGFEPLNFKATDIVFRSELSATLDNKNEPDPDMIIANAGSVMRDLSGSWKLNNELSISIWPKDRDMIHYIHQYDSDSIMFNTMMTFPDGIKRDRKESYVFNTAKKTLHPDFNYKSILLCKIAADGQSFSITHRSRDIVETIRHYQRSQRLTTYSLNEEGKQLIMREYSIREDSSDTGKEIQLLIFDRM